MTYKFNDEDSLGKTVQNVKPFCKLIKKMDVPEEKYIVGDFNDFSRYPGLVGRKWSRLCGFTFKSADGQLFQFVYVPKLRGTLARNQKALSGWYCWTLFSQDELNKQVTSIEDIRKRFGFDINKFVHSDMFDKWVPIFKSNIKYVLDNQVNELLSQPKSDFNDYKELVRYVTAIKDSIAKMDEVKQIVVPDDVRDDSNTPDYAKGSTPKVGHAKIAYNADKTYDLRNRSQLSKDELNRKQAIDKIANRLNAHPGRAIKDQSNDTTTKKQYVKFDPSLKYKTKNSTVTPDSEIFDKYDDYNNDDFR